MKLVNYFKILMLLVVMGGLSSCEKIYEDDEMRNSTQKLCSKAWRDSFEMNDGRLCTQTLEFYSNGTGKDIRWYQTWNNTTKKWNARYGDTFADFDWVWKNDMETLEMYYVNGDNYFDNVWVREHYLSGELDGEAVVFTDSVIF